MKFFLEIMQVRPKSIITLGALLIINIAVGVYVFFWQNPRNESLQTLRNEQQRLLASGGGGINTNYRQGVTDLATFNGMVPPRKSFARVVGELLELAQNSGLTTSGLSYKPELAATSGLMNYALSFSVTGKYAAVKSYLADLQRFKEMVVVEQFSLSGGKTTEEIVDLKLHLTVYLQAVGK